jgi:carboxyl-terminal processing protease
MKRILILVLIMSAVLQATAQMPTPTASTQLKKITQVLYAVKELYVDSVNEVEIVDNAVKGILENLDPHSVYITAKDAKLANEPIQGSFDGIGIMFQMQRDTLLVINTLPNCPAEKAGMLMGDKIISVDSVAIAGVKINNRSIMDKLRGKRGTKVRVEVKRTGVKKPIEMVMTRDKIPIYSLECAYEIAPKVGYININSFSLTTMKEFDKAFGELKQKGINKLIIDLQLNGGGVMEAATQLVDKFIPKNKLIVYTQGEHSPRRDVKSEDNNDFTGDLVVLVDEYSASASEIVSGALQDWDRAVIVGRRTFGKGLVQRPLNLTDGSEIRLTVARYYTPSGRNIQKPYNSGTEKYHKELLERMRHGELQHADSINFPDSLKHKTLQLGRVVYGGGGIMPDVFVPLDTTRYTDFHRNIVAKGIFNQTVMDFIEKEKQTIKKQYADFEQFNNGFAVSEEFLEKLAENAKEEKIEYKQDEWDKSKALISLQAKALIARNLYEQGDYYKIMNTQNAIVQKGLEVINNMDKYLK